MVTTQNSKRRQEEASEGTTESQSSPQPETNKRLKTNDNVTSSLPTVNQTSPNSPLPLVDWPWIALRDPESSCVYYYNASTGLTTWNPPSSSSNSSPTTPSSFLSSVPPQDKNLSSSCNTTNQSSKHISNNNNNHGDETQTSSRPSPASSPLGPPIPSTTSSTSSSSSTTTSSSSSSLPASMKIFVEHFKAPSHLALGRPARQQIEPPSGETTSYVQGSEEYNIWYGKYLTREEGGRRGRERQKAVTRCNPFTDSGWTRADFEVSERPVFCLYYAKGCCYLGANCRYFHRLPTLEDHDKVDMIHDIFGRERFASHRDDMDGVGSFNQDCNVLFVGDLKVNREFPNAIEKTEELINQQFGVWGPIDSIRVIPNKNIAFVRYQFRSAAEFAKVAMSEQKLILSRPDDQISVRWSHPCSRNKEENVSEERAEWEEAERVVLKKLEKDGYSQADIDFFISGALGYNHGSYDNDDDNNNNDNNNNIGNDDNSSRNNSSNSGGSGSNYNNSDNIGNRVTSSSINSSDGNINGNNGISSCNISLGSSKGYCVDGPTEAKRDMSGRVGTGFVGTDRRDRGERGSGGSSVYGPLPMPGQTDYTSMGEVALKEIEGAAAMEKIYADVSKMKDVLSRAEEVEKTTSFAVQI